jgi:hypothetical protein
MEGDPNKFTMESKKNLARENSSVETLLNENWEKCVSKQFSFNDEFIVYYKHKTKDFIISEGISNFKFNYRITTDNSFSYFGEWYPQYHLSKFYKGYDSIQSLIKYSNKL